MHELDLESILGETEDGHWVSDAVPTAEEESREPEEGSKWGVRTELMAWPPKARAGDGLHFYFCSVWISDLKCFFPHGSFVRMFLDVLGLFCNEFICLKQWQHKFSVEWGERSASLTRLLDSRVLYSIHAEKGSCFTQCCFLFLSEE